MQYRIKKMWGDVWALEFWGVVDFDGIHAHDWKHVKTCDSRAEAFEAYQMQKWGKRLDNFTPYYFEAYEDNESILTYHETFDDALDYIEECRAAVETICEIGGTWEAFDKCDFCKEWTPRSELNDEHICEYCEQAIKAHGG